METVGLTIGDVSFGSALPPVPNDGADVPLVADEDATLLPDCGVVATEASLPGDSLTEVSRALTFADGELAKVVADAGAVLLPAKP